MGFGRVALPKPAPVSMSASQHATACGLRLIIPSPTPVSPPKGFLRPAVDVGYPLAEVGVKHPSLFSLSRVSLLGVTIGTKQAGHKRCYSPSLGEDRGGRSPETNVVDKPPSTAAVPPHRIRLEAAPMASSLDTTSTPVSVPIERLCFVDVSGEGRMPVGADPPLQL